MKPNHAMALSIGMLGGIDTLLTLTVFPVPVWVTFIAWASFFACGGGTKGLVRSVLSNWTGIAIVTVTLLAMALLGPGSAVIAAICVGLGSGAMVLVSSLPALGYPPAIVFGFACTVGIASAGAHPITTPGIGNPALIAAVAMPLGALFGIASEWLGNALTARSTISAAAN